MDPAVLAAMMPYLTEIQGNPSSVHHVGRRARALLDDARDRVSKVLKCKQSEVVFTSGGTESSNLAIFGTARFLKPGKKHLITSTIEHHAVLHCVDYLEKKEGFEVTRLPVTREGMVSPDDLRKALRPDTALVSIMAVNNEIGTVQPVAELGAICRERGVLFHTDAVQWFGKELFANIDQFNADMVSICAHKIHGPKGAGVLYIKSPLLPDPVIFGGSHENERRAGTENLAAIIGLAEAMERFVKTPVFDGPKIEPLTGRLASVVEKIEGVMLVGSRTNGLANTISFVVEASDSIALLAGMDLEGICASSGSACTAGSVEPSHVILALGLEKRLANALVRFSLGRDTNEEEIEIVEKVLPRIIHRAQHTR